MINYRMKLVEMRKSSGYIVCFDWLDVVLQNMYVLCEQDFVFTGTASLLVLNIILITYTKSWIEYINQILSAEL